MPLNGIPTRHFRHFSGGGARKTLVNSNTYIQLSWSAFCVHSFRQLAAQFNGAQSLRISLSLCHDRFFKRSVLFDQTRTWSWLIEDRELPTTTDLEPIVRRDLRRMEGVIKFDVSWKILGRNQDWNRHVSERAKRKECSILETDIRSCHQVAKISTLLDRPRNILLTLAHSPRFRDLVIFATHCYNKTYSRDMLNSKSWYIMRWFANVEQKLQPAEF
ncbi:hypothetical protein EVAR_95850_1 [Eumeta japonica]|uniref:Uncharacterized protein n=1 Tax=Eumeta variegata TaxID=151549 RepID=A0A4C1VJW2_EUMVA|nr:hypothetical protein EVAR_95850_1 [Eumeta japonica]